MRKIVAVTSILLTALILGGCYKNRDDSLTVDIDIEFSGSGTLVMAPLIQVNDALADWEDSHPDMIVERRDRIRNEDYINLGVLGADHLPNVFITDFQTGRILAEYGLIHDEPGYVYPVFRESVSVIVYDPLIWEEGSPVGYCAENGYTIVDNYLSSCLADNTEQEWLSHMIAGDCECSFTDDVFVQCMSDLQNRVNSDIPYYSFDELVTSFADGSCPAAAVSGNGVYSLLDYVHDSNPTLYDRIGFTTIEDGYLPIGYQYGVFISADVESDRLDACADLASCLSGSFDEIEDSTLDRLEFLIDNSEHVASIRQFFCPHFWQYSVEDCFNEILFTDSRSPEEYASVIQNYYEIYYLFNYDK